LFLTGKKDVEYIHSVESYKSKAKSSLGSKQAFLNGDGEKVKQLNNNQKCVKFFL